MGRRASERGVLTRLGRIGGARSACERGRDDGADGGSELGVRGGARGDGGRRREGGKEEGEEMGLGEGGGGRIV